MALVEGVAGETPTVANTLPLTRAGISGVADDATTSAKLWIGRSLAAGDALAYKFVPGVGLFLKNGATADGAVNATGIVSGKGLAVTNYGASGTTPTFPNAAALADATATPTTTIAGTASHGYNGTTWDRLRGNIEGTLLASAARTAQITTAAQTNHNARGVMLTLLVTAKSGTTTLEISVSMVDPVSGASVAIARSGAFAAGTVAPYVLQVYPGVLQADVNSATFNQARSLALPRVWTATVVPSDAVSVTYSLGFSLIV